MSRNGWKKFTNGYVAITLKQVAINKKQMNVRKWAYKNKKIILNQFAKDTQLNTVLKSALKSGIAFQIKGNPWNTLKVILKKENLTVASSDRIGEK